MISEATGYEFQSQIKRLGVDNKNIFVAKSAPTGLHPNGSVEEWVSLIGEYWKLFMPPLLML